MQFLLQFRVDQLSIPVAYHYPVQSMLYALLRDAPGLAGQLHDTGLRFAQRDYKLFCFGRLDGPYRYDRICHTLLFPTQLTLELRTPVPELAEAFRAQLIPGRRLTLLGQSLLLEGVTLRVNAITEPVCRIKMCTPLYIDRTDAAGTTALSPFDPDFFRLIEQNAARKYQAFTGQMAQGIEFRALAVDEARNKEVTRYIGSRMLTAWFGLYRLRGTPEELSFLYEAGLGAKNAAGFGMFEPIKK